MKQTQRTEKKAEFLPSLLVMVAAILVLVGGILVLKLDPHIPLIMCTFVLVFYGLYLGISWSDMMSSAVKSISECIEAIIIMMSIGMVVGAWIAGGTVPFIIYWGLKIFSPQWLLPFTVVLCALMSTLIGSSWTTAGTIGVAFMGIGMGLGIPAPIVAGAVVCGSFFGATQSPMSDGCHFATAISGAGLYNGVRGTARTQRARALLDMVEMGDRAGHAPSQLSGGQKQRVAIARAMANDPAILLADAPTGALDSATGRLVMDLFHRLHREQGKTIVLITHSPELAGECQRIVTIKDGRVTGVRRGGGAADAAV